MPLTENSGQIFLPGVCNRTQNLRFGPYTKNLSVCLTDFFLLHYIKLELFFLQKNRCLPPSPFWRQKDQNVSTEIMVFFFVKYRFHIQQRYLAGAENYCTTNPSFGKKVIIIYYFHYYKKSHVKSNYMHIFRSRQKQLQSSQDIQCIYALSPKMTKFKLVKIDKHKSEDYV